VMILSTTELELIKRGLNSRIQELYRRLDRGPDEQATALYRSELRAIFSLMGRIEDEIRLDSVTP
jgi:hypothetical protein